MRVAVVGAGISGLGAARKLAQAGFEVVVFEKSHGLGGRCATRRVEGYTFDTGASTIAPRGKALEPVMLQELSTADLVKVEKPVWTMGYGRVAPGDAAKMAIHRYAYSNGVTTLAKLMAHGLEIRLGAKVEKLERESDGWKVDAESYDRVILATPTPQAEALLETAGEKRALNGARYRPCLSVLLGYAQPIVTPYHALVDPEQQSQVIWISVESEKSPGRAPEGHSAFVAQFGARASLQRYEDSDYEIVREALTAMERLYGKEWRAPAVSQVKRWRYSQPEMTAAFDRVNPEGSTLIVAGDGVSGPRVEFAYEAGLKAAERIMQGGKP